MQFIFGQNGVPSSLLYKREVRYF